MNFSLYLLERRGSQWEQYPSDFTAELFPGVAALGSSESRARLVVWPHRGIVYYIYVQRMEESAVGVALGFNGVMVGNTSRLVDILRGIVTDYMPRQTDIIKYDSSGKLVFSKPAAADTPEAYTDLMAEMSRRIDDSAEQLDFAHAFVYDLDGPAAFRTAQPSVPAERIHEMLFKERRAVVFDLDEGFDSDPANRVIAGLRQQISTLDDSLRESNEEIERLEYSRKQYRFVIILLTAVVAVGIGFISVYNSLKDTRRDLEKSTMTLGEKEALIMQHEDSLAARGEALEEYADIISVLSDDNRALNDSIEELEQIYTMRVAEYEDRHRTLEDELRAARNRYSDVNDKLRDAQRKYNNAVAQSNIYPLLIKSISISSSLLFVNFSSAQKKDVTVIFRFYNNSNQLCYTLNALVPTKVGTDQTLSYTIEPQHLTSATYVVAWCDGKIIGGCNL